MKTAIGFRHLLRAAALLLPIVGFVQAADSVAADVDAVLQWGRRVTLGTPVSGNIAEVMVQAGDAVAKGAPLLRLDERGFAAAVDRAEAALARLTETRAEARRELDRAQELYDRTVLSEHELQIAKIGFTTADADYRAARAQLTQARLELEYSVVRAPFDALVIQRNAEPGQTVISRLEAEPLMVVAERGRMQARAEVAPEQAGRLQAGQLVQVTTGDRRFEATLVFVGLEPVGADTGAQARYEVLAEFSYQPDTVLRAGAPAVLRLP